MYETGTYTFDPRERFLRFRGTDAERHPTAAAAAEAVAGMVAREEAEAPDGTVTLHFVSDLPSVLGREHGGEVTITFYAPASLNAEAAALIRDCCERNGIRLVLL